MSEEPEESASGPGGNGPAAWAALGAASRAKADRFLDEQTEFVHLQKEHLHEQRLLLLSHLKWRRFEDQMSGALKIMLVALGGVVIVAVATAMWNASQADGLVIEQFSVPPAMAAKGITGEAAAADMTGKLSAIHDIVTEYSFSRAKDVSAGHHDETHVEIPETGISVAEAWRMLRDWLGHERHLAGSFRELGNGRIALTLIMDNTAPIVVEGADVDAVETEAAEKAFAVLDPVNIVNYLSAVGRDADAMQAAQRFVSLAETPALRSDSYALWCYTTAYATGDLDLAIARGRIGAEIDPQLAVTYLQLGRAELNRGVDEDALLDSRAVLPLREADQLPAHRGRGFADIRALANYRIALLLGDFGNPAAWQSDTLCHGCTLARKWTFHGETTARLHDVRGAWRWLTAARAAGDVDSSDQAEARYYAHAEAGDWAAALDDARAGARAFARESATTSPRYIEAVAATRFAPLRAVAEAHLGDIATAQRTIGATPAACVPCDTARGDVALLAGNTTAAAYRYARTVSEALSIPFAYANWGAMLLREGRYDAAIGKFAAAHMKGPHFADPLEMWGEALMQENRSDLALAKFEEANTYAPNWGRLHLEWGKALFWAGRKDESKKQIAIAAGLDLTPGDRVLLAKWMKAHG